LFDFSTVKSVTLTPTEIKRFAEFSIFSPASQRAFVAPTPLFHGLARIYVAQRELMGDHGVAIFSTMAEARAWLGLPAVS